MSNVYWNRTIPPASEVDHWVNKDDGLRCPFQLKVKNLFVIRREDGVIIGNKPQVTFSQEGVAVDSLVVCDIVNNEDTLYMMPYGVEVFWASIHNTKLCYVLMPCSGECFIVHKKLIKLPSFFTAARENGEFVEFLLEGKVVYVLKL